MEINKFDDIRPYNNEEVAEKIAILLADPRFKQVVQEYLYPDASWEETEKLLRSYKNRKDFQWGIVKHAVFTLVNRTSKSFSSAGFEHLDKKKSYTFITNHRDIVLDASLLAVTLADHDFDTMEVAIGDNLLLQPWIEHVVRLNKSFIVRRGISMKEMLSASQHMSEYIHFTITKQNESVWIAQREGRAKDSNDRTQESVLKMLAMGSDKDFLESLEEVNICPVALSYEYDPCDYLKAKEFQQKRDNPEFKKSQRDDLLNMEVGLFGYKGRIHFQISTPINPEIKASHLSELKKNEQATEIASLIDKEIFLNYKFYPINYVSYDILHEGERCKDYYTEEDKQKVEAYFANQLKRIDLPNKDIDFLKGKMYQMYANPVKNHFFVIDEL